MKTLVKSNKSIYLFENDVSVVLTDTEITIGDPATLIIADCNSTDTVLYTDVTAPDDWAEHKHFFDGTTWTVNSDWVSPATMRGE